MDDATTPEDASVAWPGSLYSELPGVDGRDSRSWVNYAGRTGRVRADPQPPPEACKSRSVPSPRFNIYTFSTANSVAGYACILTAWLQCGKKGLYG